ncbi:hypothetical protein DFJ67_1530 [Asanoa ferruginea]|uniref:Peptidase MA superfamily protein n=1 Tax=Asanoa ferruginea TaxID=53367 RepID=A0A3D9ZE37_9ACTN|nr:hypothetical protein [Asanoa ferruginea]REF95571.1 hypothetical protein DFJ67_1530 [Asanoa ferruginea]GIF46839.1 hypothetical protein Afe04nite_13780 [Asanoa ferruginea]
MAYGDVDPTKTNDVAAVPPAEPMSPAVEPAPVGLASIEPPPRRKRGLLVGSLVALVVLLLAVPAVIVLTSGSPTPTATAATPAASAGASPTGPPPSPKAGDPDGVRYAWAAAQIKATLAGMTKAMKTGDQAAFVAAGADKNVRAELDRRFRSLRAMRIAEFEMTIDSGPFNEKKVGGFSEWGVSLQIRHCFVVTGCEPDSVVVDSTWRDSPAGYRMVKLATIKADDNGPHPWEVSLLTAAVGSRAVVAAPKQYAAQARAFLPAAERAAKIADKYVLGEKPNRYLIYLAGPSEWKKWFGGSQDWAVGFATPATEHRSDIVLRMEEIDGGYAEEVMKHEMGHVATLAGREYRDYYGENWWLTEGIAEYIEWDGRGIAGYDRQQSARRLLREKRFTGNLEKLVPADNAADWQIDGAYGLGFYATSCISDQFGHAKLMDFANEVLRAGRPSEVAAPQILKAEWSTVTKRCLAYTKQKVGS